MKESAEEGADSRCPELFVEGSETVRFHITSENDEYGNALPRHHHVIKLLRKIALKIVKDHKFAEIIVVLSLNEVKAAEGAFSKVIVPHHAHASDGIQITRSSSQLLEPSNGTPSNIFYR